MTDRWAGMSIAGPLSRQALMLALPGVDLSNEALPHMGVCERQIDDIPVRVLRLSFSGELAYEVYVPADQWDSDVGEVARARVVAWASVRTVSKPSPRFVLKRVTSRASSSITAQRWMTSVSPSLHREKRHLWVASCASARNSTAPDRWSLVGLECLDPERTPSRWRDTVFQGRCRLQATDAGT